VRFQCLQGEVRKQPVVCYGMRMPSTKIGSAGQGANLHGSYMWENNLDALGQRAVLMREATNSRVLLTTSSCCDRVSCGNIGKETISAATRSVTGKSPFL